MNIGTLKAQIRALVFGVFGIIVAIIFVRILLRLLGANPSSNFVIFWYQLSDFFIGMFQGMYPNLEPTTGRVIIEIYAVIGMVFYMIMAFLAQKSLTSVADDDGVQIIKNITDALFKIVEFLLISRFLLKLTGASVSSAFVKFIFAVSAVVYEPFKDILPTIRIGEYNISFESSTLIAIVIIIIFDLITEGIIENLRRKHPAGTSLYPAPNIMPAPVMQPLMSQPVTHQTTQPAQHITINIPQQQAAPQQPTVIDRRTVQVFSPPPAAQAVLQPRQAPPPPPPQTHYQPQPQYYPGSGQNDLERQRPVPNQQGFYDPRLMQGGNYPQQPQPGRYGNQ